MILIEHKGNVFVRKNQTFAPKCQAVKPLVKVQNAIYSNGLAIKGLAIFLNDETAILKGFFFHR